MAKKKDKKAIEKRRAKSKQEKQKKRRLKLVEERRKEESEIPFIPFPPMADINAPEGFRAVSISQALVEFGKPLMEDAGDDPDALNEVFGISNAVWNYDILEREDPGEAEEIKSKIVRTIEGIMGIGATEAEELFQKMIERKRHLFPDDFQPEIPTMMFMRKELSHIIASFNYDRLNFSEKPIPPDEYDQSAIEKIIRMDQYISDDAEYEEWEDFYFSMEEQVKEQYEKWLDAKGLTEWSQTFATDLEIFLNFIYRYIHEDLVVLKSIPPEYFEEFFFDYLLRKLITEPQEYAVYPPMVKFFFRFLEEKRYIGKSESSSVIEIIDEMEPVFIDVLRERFG
jgi:hypothetical protein